MKSLYLAALMAFIACHAAYAADATTPTPKAAKPPPAVKSTDAGAATGQGAIKPIQMSQQDRMRMCSKQATGKKGAERKTFMKSCLTTRKS